MGGEGQEQRLVTDQILASRNGLEDWFDDSSPPGPHLEQEDSQIRLV